MEQTSQMSEIDGLTNILQSETSDEEKIDLFLEGKASFERKTKNKKLKTRYASWYDPQTDTCCVVARKEGITFAYIANGTPPEINQKKPWTIEDVKTALAGNITAEKTVEPVEQIPLAVYFIHCGQSYKVPKGARSMNKKRKRSNEKLVFWPYEAPENHESKTTWFKVPENGPDEVRFANHIKTPQWIYAQK